MPVEHDDNTPGEALAIEHKRETDKAREKRLAASWKTVMDMPEGRAVIWSILGKLGLMGKTHQPGVPDHSAYLAGRREAAVELYNDLGEEHPAALLLMHKENMR